MSGASIVGLFVDSLSRLTIEDQVAGEAVSKGDPLKVDSTNGKWIRSQADVASTLPSGGIADNNAVLDGDLTVVTFGIVGDQVFVAGDRGKSLYVAIGGGTTITPPAAGGSNAQQIVGYIRSTSEMVTQINSPQITVP